MHPTNRYRRLTSDTGRSADFDLRHVYPFRYLRAPDRLSERDARRLTRR
jgi:hypothetical protein